MFWPSYAIALATPLKWLDRRAAWIERCIETPLTSADEKTIRIACAMSGVRFGAFYHWYLQKLVTSRRVRGFEKESTRRMVKDLDRTDYAPLEAVTGNGRGLLVAIPHHGHYIHSIIAIVERLRAERDVFIFYGEPGTHPGNEVFDILTQKMWLGDQNSRVHIVHDTRAGMVKAMRGLQAGGAVIIMPDVFKNEVETYLLPFLGRAINIMLGTAVLARRTRSLILPVVSEPIGPGMSFANRFCDVIDPLEDSRQESDVDNDLLDYRVMREVFAFFDNAMAKSPVSWQYVRQHFSRDTKIPTLDIDQLDQTVELILSDPRIAVRAMQPISLTHDGLADAAHSDGRL